MFTFTLALILFILVDFLLECLENRLSHEELIEMGIYLDGPLAVESR